jgi:ABC-2 type transport system permease protein
VRPSPASLLGLVVHDFRLSLRGVSDVLGKTSRRRKLAIVVFAVLALHLAASPVALWLGAAEDGAGGATFLGAATASGAVFVLPWVIASSMTSVTRMLYQRGDLDLLFSSPISARKVLAARAFALAIESITPIGLLLTPLANVAALQGRTHWLAIYPCLAASGLFGSGLGLMLALALFRLVGARRARFVSQIAATIIGGAFVLGAQVVAILPDSARAWLLRVVAAKTGEAGGLGLLITLPARAAAGSPSAIFAWAAIALAVFATAVIGFGPRFALAVQQSAGSPSAVGRTGARSRFRVRLGAALRLKEHRLLWRDPWLLSQMMLQILYTLPVSVILWRNGGVTGTAGIAFGPTLVVIAGQLSGSLAWIALSGEDAPEFLASAPVTRGQVERGKLAAIAAPVALVLAAPLVLLAIASPWGAFCALLFGLGASVSGALLNLWRQAPARRGLVLRRHSQSKLVALVEHWLSLLWALATGLAVFGSVTCVVPVALVGATLWVLRPRRRGYSPAAQAALA